MQKKVTTEILQRLRDAMRDSKLVANPLDALIVSTWDAHQSEYVAPCDCRRAFVSGFDGSAGSVVITTQLAALWTDGRYFLQAAEQMDENWTLMKSGLKETLSVEDWLVKVLPPNSRIGADPFLSPADSWKMLSKALTACGHLLVATKGNLVDTVWPDRPPRPCKPLLTLGLEFAGQSWEDKVRHIRSKMEQRQAVWLVITNLDEVAWLLNLRGNDVKYNPVFFSYILIGTKSLKLFIDAKRVAEEDVHTHLSLDNPSDESLRIEVLPYDSVLDTLRECCNQLGEGQKVWISERSSHVLNAAVPKMHRLQIPITPICMAKALKNPTEREGMRRAHIKDAVALSEFFCWLEKEMLKGGVTEMHAAEKSKEFRSQQKNYVDLSFDTISSSGPHGAVIHYKPTQQSDRPLSTNEIYLCDSGAQYK
uniref:xaa-Pro aminopeptidase 1 n=1 Tax=Myxine glutinosa TaxID=7769 RepID=UPI00358E7D6B